MKILTFQSALYQTKSYLFISSTSILLVDPAYLPNEIQSIRQKVEEFLPNRTLYLLFTHSDYDHIIGYGAFPEAKVIGSLEFVTTIDKEKKLHELKAFEEQLYIERSYALSYPKVDYIIDEDGQSLTLGDLTLEFYLAPGHTIDSLFAIIPDSKILIAGDYFSQIEFPFINHSSLEYLNTIQKVERLIKTNKINTIFPGHGPIITGKKRISTILLENKKYLLEMRNVARTSAKFDEVSLWKRYARQRGLREAHIANIKKLDQELQK